MQVSRKPGRLGRRGKIFVTLAVIFGTIALLLYFEQIAIIYIGSALALIVLLIVVAFSDLERIGTDAIDEAYMSKLIDDDFTQMAFGMDQNENASTETKSPSTSKADAM